jgi:cysteine synthase
MSLSTSEPRIDASVLDRIGDTPLVALRRIVPDGCAGVLIKLESANPTGSMKDRMALAMMASGPAA